MPEAYLIWNGIVLLLYGLDKWKAVRGRWRISEKLLLLCAFVMGALGAGLGMLLFRHKTRKTKFRVLIPLALLINAAAIVGWLYLSGRIL